MKAHEGGVGGRVVTRIQMSYFLVLLSVPASPKDWSFVLPNWVRSKPLCVQTWTNMIAFYWEKRLWFS